MTAANSPTWPNSLLLAPTTSPPATRTLHGCLATRHCALERFRPNYTTAKRWHGIGTEMSALRVPDTWSAI